MRIANKSSPWSRPLTKLLKVVAAFAVITCVLLASVRLNTLNERNDMAGAPVSDPVPVAMRTALMSLWDTPNRDAAIVPAAR